MSVRWSLRAALIALALFAAPLTAPSPALAVQPEEILDDPALEARARELSKGLRCVVCENQTIDESEAPLAGDMRRTVRARLLAGDTDDQILARLEEAYGPRIHMSPPLRLEFILLWLVGPLILAAGAYAYFQRVRAAPAPAEIAAAPPPPELTPEEQARLKRLLDE